MSAKVIQLHAERDAEIARERERLRAEDPPPDKLGVGLREQLARLGEGMRFATEDEQRARAQWLDRTEWEKRLQASGIWEDLDDDSRRAIVTDTARDEKPLRRIREWYARRHPESGVSSHAPPWIFLCGPPGIGKSTAAAWVVARQGGVYTTMSLLLADFLIWKRARPEERHKTNFARTRAAKCVVWDEWGTERDVDAELAREGVFTFVNGRQSHSTDTICLSNMTGQQMAERIQSGVYDVRTHSRLRALAILVGLTGQSLRSVVPGGGL